MPIPDNPEMRALMDAMDDQAESFLVACVSFAKYMQTEVEFALAHDILKAMTEEMYARLAYNEARINPINGRYEPGLTTEPGAQGSGTTVRFAR